MRKWIFPVLSTMIALIVSIATYSRLPEEMAIHFGASGEPDNWLNRPMGAFLLPALIILVSFLIQISLKFEKNENKRLRGEASVSPLMAIVSAIVLAVHLFTIAYNLGYELNVFTVVTVIVGIIFILIGNLLPRLPQSSMKWPKIPETVHRKASRFQGRIMMLFGILFTLLALLPTVYIIPIFFSLFVIFIITLIGSSVHYSR